MKEQVIIPRRYFIQGHDSSEGVLRDHYPQLADVCPQPPRPADRGFEVVSREESGVLYGDVTYELRSDLGRMSHVASWVIVHGEPDVERYVINDLIDRYRHLLDAKKLCEDAGLRVTRC